jgi:hypothetical protein
MAADPNAVARPGAHAPLGVAAGCAAGFATGWNAANIGAVAPTLAHDYRTSLAVVGLFTGGFYLALAASIFAGVVGMLALAAARPLSVAVVGSVVVGLAAGFPFAPMPAAATRARPVVRSERRWTNPSSR